MARLHGSHPPRDLARFGQTSNRRDMEVEDERSDRRGIHSLEVGLGIVEALHASEEPQTLKELAARAGVPASNCHRYLVSFVRGGIVVQDPASSRYQLGPKLIQAALAALSRLDPLEVSAEALGDLAQLTGRTCALSVWTERGPVIVQWKSGARGMRTSLSAGSTLPFLDSATGRTFLAFLPPIQTRNLIEGEDARFRGAIDTMISDIRHAGVAHIANRDARDLNSVAAPIIDHYGDAVAVLSMMALSDGFADEEIEQLRAIAISTSSRLGWIGSSK